MTNLDQKIHQFIEEGNEIPADYNTYVEEWLAKTIQDLYNHTGDPSSLTRMLTQQVENITEQEPDQLMVNLPIANSTYASPKRSAAKNMASPASKLGKSLSSKKKRPQTAVVKSSGYSPSPAKSKKPAPVKNLVDLVKKRDRLTPVEVVDYLTELLACQ